MSTLFDWFDKFQNSFLGWFLKTVFVLPIVAGVVLLLAMGFGVFLSCVFIFVVVCIAILVVYFAITLILSFCFKLDVFDVNERTEIILMSIGGAIALAITIYIIALNPDIVFKLMDMGTDYPLRLKP